MNTIKQVVLACTVVETMMHGVRCFTLEGKTLTAKYSDGSEASVTAKPTTIARIVKYYRYQNENGPEGIEPNTLELVSEIQSAKSTHK